VPSPTCRLIGNGTSLDVVRVPMEMARPKLTDRRRTTDRDLAQPTSAAELRRWAIHRFGLDEARTRELLDAIDSVVAGQRQLLEDSKHEAMRALAEGFATKMERLQQQLDEKEVTVSN